MKTILVVDDNPTNIGLLFDYLNHAGYKTLVAQDGKSAVDMARRLQPDLILLDIIMPGMDGFAACRALKQAPETADIPIFFMTALSDVDSKVKGFQCGGVDFISKPFEQEEVLARIQTHLTIQAQQKSLIRANHIKEKIISVVAHDLRNPFTAIFAYIRMLRKNYDRYDDARRKDYLQKIDEANHNLFSLVESLLDWITTGDGTLNYRPETVNLGALVSSVCETATSLAGKKSIRLVQKVDPAARVHADENMLAAVIRNLVSNALKFTPKSGTVSVSGGRADKGVCLTVTDTGKGMDTGQIALIHNGKKIHSTRGTEDETGSGMGLLICLEFIRMMGGELKAESVPDQGSCFTVWLPAAPAA